MQVCGIVLLFLLPCVSASPPGRRLFLAANPAVPGIKGVPGVLQRAAPVATEAFVGSPLGTRDSTVGPDALVKEVEDLEESTEIQADKEMSRDGKTSKRKKIWGKIQKKYKQAKKKTKQWEQDLQHKKQDMKRRSQHQQKDGQQEAPEIKALLVLPEEDDEEVLQKDDELVNKDNQWQEKVAKTPVTV